MSSDALPGLTSFKMPGTNKSSLSLNALPRGQAGVTIENDVDNSLGDDWLNHSKLSDEDLLGNKRDKRAVSGKKVNPLVTLFRKKNQLHYCKSFLLFHQKIATSKH